MKNVNDRFIEFYNSLISQNIVRSAKEFAENIEVSSSLITEIAKGRSIVGTKAIQNTVLKYSLNADWLFTGDGNMVKADTDQSHPTPAVDNASIGFILDRYEALVAENTSLKIENKELRTSRGKSINTLPYSEIHPQLESHIAAEPKNKKKRSNIP